MGARLMLLGRVIGAVFLTMLVGCYEPSGMLVEGVVDDGRTLVVGVNACEGGRVEIIDENPEKVVLKASVKRQLFGGRGDCAGSKNVHLSEPLADRPVFDVRTGEEVDVYRGEPSA